MASSVVFPKMTSFQLPNISFNEREETEGRREKGSEEAVTVQCSSSNSSSSSLSSPAL